MKLVVREEKRFKYIDEGEGEVLVLLHGLFGALSNWNEVVSYFSKSYRVLIPMMPLYDSVLSKPKLEGLVSFIEKFVEYKELKNFTIIGNSLGGHVGLMYLLENKSHVKRLILTGSSGLYENSMGGTYPKRGDYEFVKKKVAFTFYSPEVATEDLVDEVYSVVTSRLKCLRMIGFARSAQKNNLASSLPQIEVPTLLIWGLNDQITPPDVAHQFDKLIPNTDLKFIDKCGHAPMMEHPQVFNKYVNDFLEKNPL